MYIMDTILFLVNHMVCLVNDALRVTEEEAVRRVGRVPSIPAHQIQEHISVLNIQLTQMLVSLLLHFLFV